MGEPMGEELVPYLRALAEAQASELRVSPGDLAYWQAADRIEILEATLSNAYAMISAGPATEIARTSALRDIAAALAWSDAEAEVAAKSDALVAWTEGRS